MSSGLAIVIILVLLAIGALPRWSYSRSWGRGPFSGVSLVLVIVLVLILTGQI